jgi:ribosomal protein L7/L12
MGISRLTALEIYTNPTDLEFKIVAESEVEYGVMVMRGPGHNFKLLLMTEAVFEKREMAIDSVRTLLSVTLSEGKRMLDECSGALKQEDVEDILRELAEKGSCSTCPF